MKQSVVLIDRFVKLGQKNGSSNKVFGLMRLEMKEMTKLSIHSGTKESGHNNEAVRCGRRSGQVLSALCSGSKDPGSSPGQAHWVCSWARHFTLTVALSTQEYKWIPSGTVRETC